MFLEVWFIRMCLISTNLNSLRADVAVQGDGIFRPSCRIILIPLQILDCPERESARCTLQESSQRASLYLDIPLDWSDSSFRQSILAPSKGGKTETTLWHLSTRPACLPQSPPPVREKCAASALCFKNRIEPNLYGFGKLDIRLKETFRWNDTKNNIIQ